MESIPLTIKFVALYGLTVFVIAVVGATVIAGLYQAIRGKVRSVPSESRGKRTPVATTVQKRE